MAQTILVSGATGVIGGRLVSLLSREGADVRALSRTPERIAERPRQGVTAGAWDGVHAPSDAVRGTAAVVHLACRTMPASGFGPVFSQWVLDIERQPDGSFRVAGILWVSINRQTPSPDLGR